MASKLDAILERAAEFFSGIADDIEVGLVGHPRDSTVRDELEIGSARAVILSDLLMEDPFRFLEEVGSFISSGTLTPEEEKGARRHQNEVEEGIIDDE